MPLIHSNAHTLKPSHPVEIEIQRSAKGVTAKLNSYKKISTGDDLTEKQRFGLQDFMRRYEAMTPKSKAMAQRHRQFYADPRSVTGFSKLWKEVCYQIAHERSKGSHIWDVDGNEYVDYVMSDGVALFGHMPDFVERAAAAAIQRGNSIDLLPPDTKALFDYADIDGVFKAAPLLGIPPLDILQAGGPEGLTGYLELTGDVAEFIFPTSQTETE